MGEPFCRVAVRCSPSSCFSTVAIRGFLGGGVGAEEELMLQIRACHAASHCTKTAGTHCVLWSRYVITLSASSSSRLLTWWRYSGTYEKWRLEGNYFQWSNFKNRSQHTQG